MAMSERLAYILTFDTSSGVKSLQHLGSTADKELAKAEKRLDKVGTGLKRFGAGAMAAAGLAGAALFKMGQGAADADANMSALEQVVGEVVARDLGKWAEDSAKGVGMASKDAVAAATTFAQLGKIIGLGGQDLSKFSRDLVTLSADFAAFKNVAPEQALQDIQAAFAGSTEVMRKYGIFLDDATLKTAYFRETGEQVTGTLTAQQKIVAINSELYRQGADMLGQWGRESGELSGQQAILRAELTNLSDEIGAGVLPMMVGIFGAVNSVVGAMGSMDAATNGMVGKFAALAVGGVAVLGAMSMIVGQAITMRANLALLAGKFTGVTKALVALKAVMVAHPIMAFAAVAVGVGVALGAFGESSQAAEAKVDDLAAAMRGAETAADGLAAAVLELITEDDLLRKAMLDAGVSAAELTAAMMAGGSAAEAMAEKLMRSGSSSSRAEKLMADLFGTVMTLSETTRAAAQQNAELESATRGTSQAMVQASIDAALYGEATDDVADATDDAADAANAAVAAIDNFGVSVEGSAEASRIAKDALDAQRDAVVNLYNATLESIDSSLAYRNQQARTTEEIIAASDALKEHGESSGEYAQASRDAEGAVLSQAAAAVQLYKDTAASNDVILTAEEETAIYRSELVRMADQLSGPARDAVLGHIAAIDAIPEKAETIVKADTATADSNIDVHKNKLLDLDGRTATTTVRNIREEIVRNFQQTGNQYGVGPSKTGWGRKSGGPVPGARTQAVPITAHGGEYVLDAGTVDAIKKGQPSAGKATGGTEQAQTQAPQPVAFDHKAIAREMAREFAKVSQLEMRAR